MCILRTALLLLFSTQLWAKKPEIYRCKQADGSTVIQDRRCVVTGLQKSVAPKSRANKTQNRNTSRTKPPVISQPRVRSQSPKNNQSHRRSGYFTFGWDRFIPVNWQMHKLMANGFDRLLLSKSQFKGTDDFDQGVELDVYGNTMTRLGKGAFAQALVLYHRIRDNTDFQLLDSQFKTHESYKVFNIKYLQANQRIALTEFYIDERHNDLFVVTVQASEANWSLYWQMAERIINQL